MLPLVFSMWCLHMLHKHVHIHTLDVPSDVVEAMFTAVVPAIYS